MTTFAQRRPPSAPASGSTPERYHRVQALRFFAALSVVVYHASFYVHQQRTDAGPLVRLFQHSGQWGVPLFFAISGFVIAHGIERMSVAEFARRRFLRIYPPFWLAVGLTLAAGVALFGVAPQPYDLLRALTLLPFGPLAYPLGVEWTLVYEVFFYAVVAVAALRGWTRTRDAMLLAWSAAIVAGALVAPEWSHRGLPTPAQIAFSPYSIPFLLGVVVHRLHLRLSASAGIAALVVGPVLILAARWLPAGAPALSARGLGCAALVLWAVLADRRKPIGARNPFVVLGDWSYGLYLLHVPIITILLALGVGTAWPADAVFAGMFVVAVTGGSLFGAFESALHRTLLRVTRPAVRAMRPG